MRVESWRRGCSPFKFEVCWQGPREAAGGRRIERTKGYKRKPTDVGAGALAGCWREWKCVGPLGRGTWQDLVKMKTRNPHGLAGLLSRFAT